jgi:RecA-family ATPase
LGKQTTLAGDPDLGKSIITLDMAARVSCGTPWPDCLDKPNEAGGVVLLTAEDGLEDTVVPRLIAAGADLSRIIALTAVQQRDPNSTAQSGLKFLGEAVR